MNPVRICEVTPASFATEVGENGFVFSVIVWGCEEHTEHHLSTALSSN